MKAWILICAMMLFVISSGCSEPTVVDAEPRISQFEPKFGLGGGKPGDGVLETQSKNSLKTDFLHPDHFACLQVEFSDITNNKELAEVPWEAIEERLLPWVGASNAKLAAIERLWVLLDRENLTPIPGGSSGNPMVMVLEYKAKCDATELEQAVKAKQSELEAETPSSFSAIRLDEKRIAIGDEGLTKKLLENVGSETGLGKQFGRLSLDAEVNGLITIQPIRSFLQGIFDMAASFSPDLKEMAALPDLTQQIDLAFSIDDEKMLVANIVMEDEQMTKKLTRQLSEQFVNGGPGGGGMLPFSAMGGAAPVTMSPVESTAILQEVGKDIAENQLLRVESEGSTVSITLARPEKIKELVAAFVNDGQKQMLVEQRKQSFAKIGAALKAYEEAHGCLPSSEAVVDDGDEVPNQFSWRVAILPELGEQELYDQFDFTKAWDSSENLKVAEQIPDVFKDAMSDAGNQTRIHIPFGEKGLYRSGRKQPKLTDIIDKSIWTAIVVSGGAKSSQVWTQPGTLDVDSTKESDFGVEGENGVFTINAAFKTRIAKRDGGVISAMLTTGGEEKLRRSDFLSN
jgi:hypothetical protein